MERLSELIAYCEHGIERGHRLLEDHAYPGSPYLAHLPCRELHEVASLEYDLPANDPARRIGDETHDRKSGYALAAAALANQRHRLALMQVERNAVHGPDDSRFGRELGAKASHG